MTTERTGIVTFKGAPLTLAGTPAAVGAAAPDFMATGNDLAPAKLSDWAGRTVILASVPSLDTAVCDLQTRRFNELAAGKGFAVLTLSMDLPFAQARWCGAAGVKDVTTLSDHRDADFGLKYGLLVKELRLLARAVLVVDGAGVVRHLEVVPEMTDLPDFDAALAAAGTAAADGARCGCGGCGGCGGG